MSKLRFVLTAVLVLSLVTFLAACGAEYDSGDDVMPVVKYSFSYSVNDDAYGSLSCRDIGGNKVEAGNVAAGTIIRVSANPQEGYALEGFYANGEKVSSANPYKFSIDADTALSAVFVPKTYAYSYEHIGVQGAVVSSDVAAGKIAYGTRVTLTASAVLGYEFDGWYVVDEKVSADAVYAFDMPARSIKVVGRYRAAGYELSAVTVGCDGASITGLPEGKASYDSSVTLTASAEVGYDFLGWFDGDEKLSSDLSYSFRMPANDLSLTAKYEIKKYALHYAVEGSAAATVVSSVEEDTVAWGTGVTLTASAEAGFRFDGWYVGDEKVSTEYVYGFVMPENALSLVAKYVETKTVNFYDGADLYATIVTDSGSTVELPAFTKPNYDFVGWYEDAALSDGKKFDGRPITENLNLYAKTELSIIYYEAVFVDHDGTEKSVQKVSEGNTVSIPAAPARKGYKFEGWFIDGNTESELTDEYAVTADITAVAVYSKEKYDVSFAVDGKTVSVQKVEYLDCAKIPQTPQKEGYIFVEWRLGGYAFDFASKIDEAIDVEAYFEIAPATTFKVRFYAAEGDAEPIDVQIVEDGSSATAPQEPEKIGLRFKEWDKSFDVITSDTDVYATYDTATFTVKFSYYTGEDVKETETVVSYGENATAPLGVARIGYTFVGWDKAFDVITADITVTAVYDIDTYTATFMIGDAIVSTDNAAYGGHFHVPATPEIAGYSFVGWFFDEDFETAFDFNAAAVSDVDVYGKTEEIVVSSFTVRFLDWNGAVISEQTVIDGGYAIAPGSPEREGYAFDGWDRSFAVVTENMTVNAVYRINSYTVTCYGEDGTTKVGEVVVSYGEDATAYVSAPEITGKKFVGWSAVITSVKRNMSVYAIYTAEPVYVYFRETDGTILISQVASYGGTASVPTTPVKNGYIFKGWYADDKLETRYDFNTAIEDLGGVSVYAKWEKKSGLYTVYFKDYDGEYYGNSQKVVAGYYVSAPSAPVKDGVEFGGWYDEDTGELFDVDATPITCSITLVARAK